MCSSQPRLTPSRSFSSGQIQFWTTPAISSPSQATTHRSVSSSGRAKVAVKSALGHLAMAPVVAERLVLGVEDARGAGRPSTGRISSPSGSGASGIGSSEVAAHQEEVADRLEPDARRARAAIARPRRPRRRPPSSTAAPGSSTRPRLRRTRSRFQPNSHVPMPAPPDSPDRRRPRPRTSARRRGRPARRRSAGDEPAVDLDDDDVLGRIDRRRSPPISISQVLGGRHPRHAVGARWPR